MASIMARNCGKELSVIINDMERDCWMDAVQTVEYGIADHIGFPDFI